MDRKDVLLRAAYDLLTRLERYPVVEEAACELVHYDGTDCDGACLKVDIAAELEIDDNEDPLPLESER
jgi:hypothetical protein